MSVVTRFAAPLARTVLLLARSFVVLDTAALVSLVPLRSRARREIDIADLAPLDAMRIRLRAMSDEDELALPSALLDHDVSFTTVVRRRAASPR